MQPGRHFLKKDGTVKCLGVDYGGKVKLIYRSGAFLVVKNSGSMNWSGIGLQEYSRSEWHIIKVQLPEDVKESGPPWYDQDPENWNGLEFQILETIESVEPGRRWKTCRDNLIKKAKKLGRQGR